MFNQAYTPEQFETAKKVKSPEELIALAKEQGIEITPEQATAFLKTRETYPLPDEELDNVAGGGDSPGLLADLVDLNTVCLYGMTSSGNNNVLRTCGAQDVETGTPHCQYFIELEMGTNLIMPLCMWRARHQ